LRLHLLLLLLGVVVRLLLYCLPLYVLQLLLLLVLLMLMLWLLLQCRWGKGLRAGRLLVLLLLLLLARHLGLLAVTPKLRLRQWWPCTRRGCTPMSAAALPLRHRQRPARTSTTARPGRWYCRLAPAAPALDTASACAPAAPDCTATARRFRRTHPSAAAGHPPFAAADAAATAAARECIHGPPVAGQQAQHGLAFWPVAVVVHAGYDAFGAEPGHKVPKLVKAAVL
jgi:hypothetical protein